MTKKGDRRYRICACDATIRAHIGDAGTAGCEDADRAFVAAGLWTWATGPGRLGLFASRRTFIRLYHVS